MAMEMFQGQTQTANLQCFRKMNIVAFHKPLKRKSHLQTQV